jgi:hypothetical protein
MREIIARALYENWLSAVNGSAQPRWDDLPESSVYRHRYLSDADAVLRVLAEHGDTGQVRTDVAEILQYEMSHEQVTDILLRAVVAPIVAARDDAVERAERAEQSRDKLRASGEQHLTDLMTIADKNLDRAERAEAEVERLAAARLVLAVFGTPEDAPQPFSLCRDTEIVGLGVQWPGGAVTIKWTPPDRLATVTSASLADALAVHDPDGTLGVVWLSEDLGTLAEAEDRILAVEKLIQHREQRYADSGGTTVKAIPVADLRRAIGMEET